MGQSSPATQRAQRVLPARSSPVSRSLLPDPHEARLLKHPRAKAAWLLQRLLSLCQ